MNFWGEFWENWFKVMKNIGNFILNFKLLFGIINDDIYLIYFDQNYKFLFPLFNYINIKKYFKGKRIKFYILIIITTYIAKATILATFSFIYQIHYILLQYQRIFF